MGRRHRFWLVFVLFLIVLAGCANGALNSTDDPNGEENPQNIGTLTVYAPEQYRAALQQVFSHINLAQTEYRVSWSSDIAASDVVITDNLPVQSYGEYRVIQPQSLQVQGIDALTVRSEQGVIGLPLFLRLDGFWYDELLYKSSGIEAPQSVDAWNECSLNGQYPIICDETDMSALFWSVVAPYYLKSGGSAAELAEGNFQQESLLQALETLQNMGESGMLQLTSQAWQAFTATQATYWITGVEDVAACYNYMSNRSSWKASLSLPFSAQEQTVCVVRADVLAVRKTSDQRLTERFLEMFYRQQILADLSAYTRMPLACRMNYAPGSVPELPQVCYTLLSSPMIEVVQVPCIWREGKQQQVYGLLLELMTGSIDAAQAAQRMLQ